MVFTASLDHKAFKLQDRYSTDNSKVLGQGGQGTVFLATTKYKLTGKVNYIDYALNDRTLMDRTETFKKENVKNKKKGVVAIKQIYISNLKSPGSYWGTNEALFINSIPYHPSLIQYYEMFVDLTSTRRSRFIFVMEPMESDVCNMIHSCYTENKRRLPEKFIKDTMAQVIDGLRHIHKQGYIHRDVKPENIMISSAANYSKRKHWYSMAPSADEYVAKLGDYGLCEYKGEPESRVRTMFGTCGYRAPELMMGDIHYYDEKVDIWAIGATILQMCAITGRLLLRKLPDSTDLEVVPVLKALGYPSSTSRFGAYPDLTKYLQDNSVYHSCDRYDPVEKYIDNKDLKDVVRACLQWDPQNRASAEDLAQMPFFKGTVLNPIKKAKKEEDD